MTANPILAGLLGGVDFDPDLLREKYHRERDKRLRTDGIRQYVEVTADFSYFVDDPYVEPGFQREPLFDEVEVVIVGGGFGGLMMGGRLRAEGFEHIRVIDKAGDFGGTWYWNRYPGACCDIESYVYLPFLEETGFIPKHKYSFGSEILEYSRVLARHYDLYQDTCFQTQVTQLQWDAQADRWVISTDRGDRMRAKYVVLSSGAFDRPKLPGMPGINEFKGHTFHTCRWDYGYTGGGPHDPMTKLADKRVGIIGTGATALQCVPHLGNAAKQLYVFQRTPSSVDERNNCETSPEWVKSLEPGWQQRRMDNFVTIIHGGEVDTDLVADGWTDMFSNLSSFAAKRRAQALGRPITSAERAELMELADFKKMEAIRERIACIVKDPATAEALKPWYRQFCKRPCFHDDYLPTFNRPNVTLVDTGGRGVERLTENAVLVDGRAYELDCLIFATGFEVGTPYVRRNGYEVIGRDGRKLSEHWAKGIRSLHGMQTHGFPNLFFTGFTQTGFTFLVPFSLNEQATNVAYIMGKARAQAAGVVEATAAGEEGWCAEMRSKSYLGDKFYSACTPGYYNNEGNLRNPFGFYAGNYGGGPMRFMQILREWRAQGGLEGTELR